MPAFVLDASVAISWCFPGDAAEDTPYSRRILSMLVENDALVPHIWAYEIANCLFVSFSRRKRIDEQQVQEFLDRLRALPIRTEQFDLWSTVALEASARRWNLAAYDAAYISLAKGKRLPLATTDAALRERALAEGIELA